LILIIVGAAAVLHATAALEEHGITLRGGHEDETLLISLPQRPFGSAASLPDEVAKSIAGAGVDIAQVSSWVSVLLRDSLSDRYFCLQGVPSAWQSSGRRSCPLMKLSPI
jgi:hypothetical protein